MNFGEILKKLTNQSSDDAYPTEKKRYKKRASESTTASGSSTTTATTTANTVEVKKEVPAYVKSAGVIKAENEYEKWKSSAPTYTSVYGEDIAELLEYMQSRTFEYDHESDPVFITQRDSAAQAGRKASDEALGRAAALNGGYGTSYATSAAAQAYNEYIGDVNDIIPELYEAAYDRYRDQTDILRDELSTLQSLEADEWEKYSDLLDYYYDRGDDLYRELKDLSDADYNAYLDRYFD